MSKTHIQFFANIIEQAAMLGRRVKLARTRRGIAAALFAQRLGVSRDTLYRLERGDPHVGLGTFLRALDVLGLWADVQRLADDAGLTTKLGHLGMMDRAGFRFAIIADQRRRERLRWRRRRQQLGPLPSFSAQVR